MTKSIVKTKEFADQFYIDSHACSGCGLANNFLKRVLHRLSESPRLAITAAEKSNNLEVEGNWGEVSNNVNGVGWKGYYYYYY